MTILQDNLTPAAIAAFVERAIPNVACNLRPDVCAALEEAACREMGERGQLVLGQLTENARIAAKQQVPLCQDTGSVWVLLEVGEYDAAGNEIAISSSIFSQVDAAVARAYHDAKLRKSMVRDAFADRGNTQDNTPAFCELSVSPTKRGATLHIMLKGGGSDNASRVVMLAPGAGEEGICRAVLDAVLEKGESACPPLVIGVGIGSTFDKVAGLAKRALLRRLGEPSPDPACAALEQRLLADVNATGLGPGGFGGDVTALAVHVLTAPCHIAALPVAVNLGCNSMRSASFDLEQASFEDAALATKDIP
ncbi:MAG: fumarate hydratase [Coriobacteriales bacterium]|jgi:tartrate/fumarate subfamily iron-sulfur-dependent hydro-lyase alpha chain|nr:fumarate hydratase [Coriobacteriales bacterium]